MQTHPLRVVALTAACLVSSAVTAPAADHLLRGTVASAAGEKLGGVTVSAKAQGSTITTSVYTDEQGGYYFPPLPAGTYTVWAQALTFELAKGEVDLTAARRADLTLNTMTDVERQVRQLPGEMLMAALPEDSAADARIKRVFRNACMAPSLGQRRRPAWAERPGTCPRHGGRRQADAATGTSRT